MAILVTGSTGKVGSEVLKEPGKRNVTVRALVRKPNAKLPKGVEAIVGDLLDPVSVEKALDGADNLYLLNGVVPDELTQGLIAYGLAKKPKLNHVVYHSIFGWTTFWTFLISPQRPRSKAHCGGSRFLPRSSDRITFTKRTRH